MFFASLALRYAFPYQVRVLYCISPLDTVLTSNDLLFRMADIREQLFGGQQR